MEKDGLIVVKNASQANYVASVPTGFSDWMDYWARGGVSTNAPKKYICAVHGKYEPNLEGAHVIKSIYGIDLGDKIYIIPVCKLINDQFGDYYEVPEDFLVEIPADHYKK